MPTNKKTKVVQNFRNISEIEIDIKTVWGIKLNDEHRFWFVECDNIRTYRFLKVKRNTKRNEYALETSGTNQMSYFAFGIAWATSIEMSIPLDHLRPRFGEIASNYQLLIQRIRDWIMCSTLSEEINAWDQNFCVFSICDLHWWSLYVKNGRG